MSLSREYKRIFARIYALIYQEASLLRYILVAIVRVFEIMNLLT